MTPTMIIGRLEWWLFSNPWIKKRGKLLLKVRKATTTIKPEEEWTKDEDELSLVNN
jgi:hypothetical protein